MKKRGIILLLLLTLTATALLIAGAQRAEALTAVTTQLYVPRKESAGLMGKVYLVPDGDSFVVDTSIKAMALQDQHLSFRIVQPGKERVFIPIVEGEDFLHLDKLRKASFENRNGVCGVMIPADP